MAKNFKPLTFGMIEEGKLSVDLDEQLEKLSGSMGRYLEENGEDAQKASATLTLKIKIRCEDAKEGVFSVAGAIGIALPARPSRTTMAIKDLDEDGDACLFARASGTTEDENPRQLRITTKNGEAIDPETGEVNPTKEGAAKKAS